MARAPSPKAAPCQIAMKIWCHLSLKITTRRLRLDEALARPECPENQSRQENEPQMNTDRHGQEPDGRRHANKSGGAYLPTSRCGLPRLIGRHTGKPAALTSERYPRAPHDPTREKLAAVTHVPIIRPSRSKQLSTNDMHQESERQRFLPAEQASSEPCPKSRL